MKKSPVIRFSRHQPTQPSQGLGQRRIHRGRVHDGPRPCSQGGHRLAAGKVQGREETQGLSVKQGPGKKKGAE